MLATGCGRLGYEVLRPDGAGGDGGTVAPDAAVTRPPDPGTDAQPPIDGPLPVVDGPPSADSGAPPADSAGLATDSAAPPVDGSASPNDAAPVRDLRPPGDTVPDMPAASSCTFAASSDMIADFESGTLSTNRVSGRGGPSFHLVDDAAGTLTNVAVANCGRRAMQVLATSSRAPLVQASLMYQDAGGSSQSFDARVYRGISISLRASTPVAVRLKLSNADTLSGGNDHFQVPITVGTSFTGVSVVWSAFKQTMAGTSTQYPSFDVSRLYAVEISASLPAGATLWVDEIAFGR